LTLLYTLGEWVGVVGIGLFLFVIPCLPKFKADRHDLRDPT
jgi:hypothetical protein